MPRVDPFHVLVRLLYDPVDRSSFVYVLRHSVDPLEPRDEMIHSLWPPPRKHKLSPRPGYVPSFRSSPVVIEDDVWIGTGAVILKGTHIGRGSIIGAGAVVSGEIPPLSIVLGNPARVIRSIRESSGD